jgi:hypothetical protein
VTARLALAAALAAAAGCTVTEEVLGGDNAPITTCDEVWSRGVEGAACALTSTCSRPLPASPVCCIEFGYCAMDELAIGTDCDPACGPACVDDLGCPPGVATCEGQSCVPCAAGPADPTGPICQMTCPMGWGFLSRNGCTICQCAPLPECVPPDPNMPGQGCNGMFEECYRGDPIDPGCHPDDVGCFPTTCSVPGCMAGMGTMTGAPLGCDMPCDPMMGCQSCATGSCECDPMTGGWICQPFCIDSQPIILSCTHQNP